MRLTNLLGAAFSTIGVASAIIILIAFVSLFIYTKGMTSFRGTRIINDKIDNIQITHDGRTYTKENGLKAYGTTWDRKIDYISYERHGILRDIEGDKSEFEVKKVKMN